MSTRLYGSRIHFYRWERWTAIAVIVSLLYTFLLPSGQLLTDPRFRRFEERGRPEAEKYINRANRLSEEQSWTNYVETGIAHEQALWEAEALEEIRKELGRQEQANINKADRDANRVQYLADFEAARLKWEEEATDYINEERGGYKARLAVENFKAEIEASEGQRIQSFRGNRLFLPLELLLYGFTINIHWQQLA